MSCDVETEIGHYDIRLKQGTTWRRTMTWTIDGVPVDLTGCTIRAAIRRPASAPDPALLDLSSPANGITLDGPAGEWTIEITDTQTLDDLGGDWDLRIEFPSGLVLPRIEGQVYWDPAATR